MKAVSLVAALLCAVSVSGPSLAQGSSEPRVLQLSPYSVISYLQVTAGNDHVPRASDKSWARVHLLGSSPACRSKQSGSVTLDWMGRDPPKSYALDTSNRREISLDQVYVETKFTYSQDKSSLLDHIQRYNRTVLYDPTFSLASRREYGVERWSVTIRFSHSDCSDVNPSLN
jgi:hypothetical protein